MSTMPQPLAGSKPGDMMSRALLRRSSAICVTERVGRIVHTHAAAATTIGLAKLVPATVVSDAVLSKNAVATR